MSFSSDDFAFYKAVWVAAATASCSYDLDASTPSCEVFRCEHPFGEFRVERVFHDELRKHLDFIVFGKGWTVTFHVTTSGTHNVGEWDDGAPVYCSSMSVVGDRSAVLRDCVRMRLCSKGPE